MATDLAQEASKIITAFTGCINESTLLDLAVRFSEVYKHLAKTSLEHFLVTPVTALPTGKEEGNFISIDVGGSNLRVGFVELLGEPENGVQKFNEKRSERIKRSHDKTWPIGEHLKMDKAEDLFAWIGDCVAEVITDALEDVTTARAAPFGDEILLGITFSFPMAQKSLSEATLLPMGKGFAITSDLNLGKMLAAGYARHVAEPVTNGDRRLTESHSSSKTMGPPRLPRIRIAAITNDTVATFASLAYAVKAAPHSRVAMGLIVGTGTNATVPMSVSKLHPSKKDDLVDAEAVETVVINTEWTIRGTDQPLIDLEIKTPWDRILDENSEAPGFQPFEYMTAGRYLGEIVRLAFVDIISKDPDAKLPARLQVKNALQTRFLSEVVARADDDTIVVELDKAFAPESTKTSFWNPVRVRLLRDIAYAVQQRSSALIAAACVGLLDCVGDIHIEANSQREGTADGQNDPEELVIAYAGSTISHYPDWLETCQGWIDTLVAKGSSRNASKRVVLREALDGGIIGAGVLAGMSDQMA